MKICSPPIKLTLLAVLPFIAVVNVSAARLSVDTGNALKAFFWTQATDGADKIGCYGYTKIGANTPGSTENRFSSTFWFPTYGWWHSLFPQSYLSCTMTTSKGQPETVSRASGHFSGVPWFKGFERTDTAESVRFFFPLLPQNTAYGRYDYFTIDVDSAADLEFYGAGDSIMVGTFVDKNPAPNGAVNILARNAFIVELTKSNPLRISSIRCNGSFKDRISAFLGYNLTRFSSSAAWYGIDFIDTTTPPVISVHSIALQGTMPLSADATSKVSWSLGGASEVDSCSIHVSFDSTKTWSRTGKTLKDSSSYIWTVPQRESEQVFLKVTVFGRNGEKLSTVSQQFSTVLPVDVGIHSLTVNKPSPLSAETVCRISWSLVDASDVDSCVVSVSFDSTAAWERAGKTLQDTFYLWTVPARESNAIFFRVTTCGRRNSTASVTSEQYASVIHRYLTVSAEALSNTSILVSWNPSGISAEATGIYLAYRPGSIPVNFTDRDLDTVQYDLKTNTDTITGLQSGTTYYFAAFIINSLGKTLVTDSPAVDSVTLERDRTPPKNTCLLYGNSIDSTTIALSWQDTGSSANDIKSIGIWYTTFKFPSKAYDSVAQRAGIWTHTDSVDTITDLRPSTTYYFALFVADSLKNWSGTAAPSMVQVRTPAADTISDTVNTITILGNDTQSVLSDSVKLWSGDFKTGYTDTVDAWQSPNLSGFLEIGPAFKFRYGMLPAGSTVSLEVTAKQIPSPYSINDVLVYRYNIFSGGIRLEECVLDIDSVTGTVSFTTNDLRLPFILMIDTIPPAITAGKLDTAAYSSSKPIIDTFTITDNIENYTVSLAAGAGSLGYSDISLYAVPGKKKNQYITTIPAYVADPCSGVRGLVTVSDGRNTDSVNLSRKILRTGFNCDDTMTTALQWTPLKVTALPAHERLSEILAAANNDSTYEYDKQEARIIRWLPRTANDTAKDKWVEYSPAIDSLFTLTPGKLFWIKTKKSIPLIYGPATVPALIDTFEIVLKKGNWTDFSLPYTFPIYSGDVIGATETKAKGSSKSIELYRWEKTAAGYNTDPVFLPGIDAASDPETILEGSEAFTAYNTSSKDIRLKIPPVCTPLSMITAAKADGVAKKADHAKQWCIKIGLSNSSGTALSPIFCAGLPADNTPRFFKASPGFLPVTAEVIDEASGNGFGHCANGNLTGGGITYTISYNNTSDQSEMITGILEKTWSLPQGISAKLYKKSDRKIALPSDSTTTLVSAAKKSTSYLVVGTQAYISNFIKKVTAVFSFLPYTVNRALKIQYSLPTGTKMVSVFLFDLKGRRVDQFIKTSGIAAGEGSFLMKSTFSAGYYIVQMRIDVEDQKPMVMNRKWLYVR